MKIKNLYYRTTAVALATFMSITGFGFNVQAKEDKKLMKNEYTTEDTFNTKEVDSKEDIFVAGDIHFVHVYNPETEKDENYFLKQECWNEYGKESAFSSAKTIFKKTLLNEYFDSEETYGDHYCVLYESVLEDDASYYVNGLNVKYTDLETLNKANGANYRSLFSNGSGMSYLNTYSIVFDNEEVTSYSNFVGCLDKNTNHLYASSLGDEDIFDVSFHSLTELGYQKDELVTKDDLENLKNSDLMRKLESNNEKGK